MEINKGDIAEVEKMDGYFEVIEIEDKKLKLSWKYGDLIKEAIKGRGDAWWVIHGKTGKKLRVKFLKEVSVKVIAPSTPLKAKPVSKLDLDKEMQDIQKDMMTLFTPRKKK